MRRPDEGNKPGACKNAKCLKNPVQALILGELVAGVAAGLLTTGGPRAALIL